MDFNQIIEKSRVIHNDVRIFGVDLLKFFLSVVIVSIVIPLYFHSTLVEPLGKLIIFLYLAWISGLLSIIFALLSYLLVFEGFLNQAHYVSVGMMPDLLVRQDINEDAKKYIKKQIDRLPNMINLSESYFNWAHWIGVACACTFFISLIFIMIPIGVKLYYIVIN
jgi:hypothetical protein